MSAPRFATMADVRCFLGGIHAAWDPCPVPDPAGIVALDKNGQRYPDLWRGHQTEEGFFRSWLGGLRYDEMIRHHVFDVEFIFHYLTPEASAYYLGGSLIYWAGFYDCPEDPDEGPARYDEFPGGDIATIHLIEMLAKPSWLDSLGPYLTAAQQQCVTEVIRLLLSYPLEEWTYFEEMRSPLEIVAASRDSLLSAKESPAV